MKDFIQQLEDKIDRHDAVIGILGLGYVGLPLLLTFAEAGFRVIGFDIDKEKIDKLSNKTSYIGHIPSERIAAVSNNIFQATTNFELASQADVLIICVPTPLNKNREPDLNYVTGTMRSIQPYLREGQLLSLESTTYPGTTDEELLPRIEEKGFTVGEDFFLIYSPEREDPGNKLFGTSSIPKICGGYTAACQKLGLKIYEQVISRVVTVSSTRAAEMTKLLENIHRAVNIGLVNEMKIVADKMNIDIHEVIDAASTKPFGFTPFYPGPGLGGHCIPLDPFYLTWKAREYGLHTRFIELAGEVNQSMPEWVVNKVSDALNMKSKAIRGSTILVAGVAYKKNIEDLRESPSVDIMTLLANKGAKIEYSDPHVPKFPFTRGHSFNLSSVEISPDSISKFDCVVIATDHDAFDYSLLLKHSKMIVDTRGRYRKAYKNVVKA